MKSVHFFCAVIRSRRGMSLVEVLVVAAVGCVIALSMSAMLVNQTRETRALSEKLAANDFQQHLTRSFADGSLCTQLLQTLTFDSTYAVPGSSNPPTLNLTITSIPIGTAPFAPPLATAGKPLSPIASTLVAALSTDVHPPFEVTNIMGTSSGGIGNYTGFFQINFDDTKLVRSLKPPQTQITIQTTSSGTTQTITACSGSGSDKFGGLFQMFLCSSSGTFNSTGIGCRSPNPYTSACTCPVGYTQYHVDDWNSPQDTCPQDHYGDGLGNSGMIQYLCYK